MGPDGHILGKVGSPFFYKAGSHPPRALILTEIERRGPGLMLNSPAKLVDGGVDFTDPYPCRGGVAAVGDAGGQSAGILQDGMGAAAALDGSRAQLRPARAFGLKGVLGEVSQLAAD